MKRVMVIVFIMVFVVAACDGNIKSPKVNVVDSVYGIETEYQNISIPSTSNTTEPLKNEGDVEKNINAEKLSEDEKLTEDAEKNNITESDVIVDEKKIEDKKAENTLEEKVIRIFESKIPDSIEKNIKYNKYEVPTDYLLIMSSEANIREKPNTSSKIIGKAHYFEKINLLAEVKGEFIKKYGSDGWFKIARKKDGKVQDGYIFGKLAEPRTFQFGKMVDAINKLKNNVEGSTTAYISNYQNRVGIAPLHQGRTNDKYGIQRYQSAPAYFEARSNSDFRYISDGTLVSVMAETDSFYKIKTLNFEGEYYVPKKYVSFRESLKTLTKVIVVDRKNQNEGVFEYVNGKWNLISYIFATTGEKARFKLPTELGYYMAIQKVHRFSYLDDITREISGYAPYAIRFNGGAYIHGVPVEYKKENGRLIDPGMQEYLFTIGTVPRSHKCVRNYTSHAKFLYDWVKIGESAVIIIE
ncbi:MAG: L,D-transpeptidase family protein [Bacillota bacterium]